MSNSYDDNWHVQKYLKGIFHKGMLLIWKEHFTRAILSFSSLRCVIIARLNVIYTKFRRSMIAQLNKIWRVWACARSHVTHSQAWETYSAGKNLMLYRFLDFINRNYFALILKTKILIKCPSKFCYRYRNFQNTEAVTGSVLKKFIKFSGKHLCQSFFINAVAVIKLQVSAL